ncbi:NHL repeat containing protein [Candidatus Protofrankia datiscae]|uniref:NHL repeat containing protein n=1 Tax=Candidatus Protofrankia datiscae TaxID=2716812 RepID=F8B033_9ACTN|nr:NHL repeat containing protein [Candidatus Protofrankia datiscae]
MPAGAQPPAVPGPGWPAGQRRPSRRRMWLITGVVFTVVAALSVGITLVVTRGGGTPAHSALFVPGTAYSGTALTLPDLDAYDVTIDRAGALYITDWTSHQIRKIQPDGTVVTVAGTGSGNAGFGGDGGPATQAELNSPATTAVDSDGNVYISDSHNHRIRKIDPLGIITTIAGTGTAGFSGDGGPATAAQLNEPYGLAVATDDSIYISDYENQRIRKIDPLGIITTIAGTGTAGFSGDGGPALQAQIKNPNNLAVAADGTLYISELGNARIRKVSPNGVITTVAGNGTSGYGGDGGPATAAQLRVPSVALSPDGVLYIADYSNERIRRVATNGVITTVAGNGTAGSAGDGAAAIRAQLSSPTGVTVDGAGNLYIADDKNDRVRRVSTTGIITTVAQAG